MIFLLAGIGASLGAILRYAITNYGKKHWEWVGKNSVIYQYQLYLLT